ncbi:hypothetical protein J6590_044736 [Homalodisca vitripennis]|nr:hypothetical protein J6590_044736 [Homalodisca vitripennis]
MPFTTRPSVSLGPAHPTTVPGTEVDNGLYLRPPSLGLLNPTIAQRTRVTWRLQAVCGGALKRALSARRVPWASLVGQGLCVCVCVCRSRQMADITPPCLPSSLRHLTSLTGVRLGYLLYPWTTVFGGQKNSPWMSCLDSIENHADTIKP